MRDSYIVLEINMSALYALALWLYGKKGVVYHVVYILYVWHDEQGKGHRKV